MVFRSFLGIILSLAFFLASCTVEELIYTSERAQSPVITPLGGVFFEQQLIELSCATPGARIIYTTDGSNPSRTNGNTYIKRFYVNMFAVVKAFAIADNLNDSHIVRSAYSFKVSQPRFRSAGADLPSDTTFPADATIELINSTPGSTIYYTTDGSSPSSASNIYTSPLTFSQPTTLKAVAFKFGWSYSQASTMAFSFKAEAPLIFPNGGDVEDPVTVVLTPSIYGADIRYTLDDSTPTETSTLYTGPFTVSTSARVRAITIKPGMQTSDPALAEYVFRTRAPNLSPGTGRFTANPNVSLTSTPGSTIYYTLDGTIPTSGSTVYSGPFSVGNGVTVNAIAQKSGFADSAVSTGVYSVNPLFPALAPPTVSTPPGSYSGSVNLTLTSPDSAGIRYTVDGSTPSLVNGITYEGPFLLESSVVVKALCFQDGAADSSVFTGTYNLTGDVTVPELVGLTDGQICNTAVKLEAVNPTFGAVIHFTINGSDPTENDYVYHGPISLASGSKTLNIRLKSFKPGWNPSPVVNATITYKLPNPNFNPVPGEISKVANVILSQSVLGASTRYTLDGSDPTPTAGTLYNGEILVLNSTTTVKAISYKTGWEDSQVVQGLFTVIP